MVVSFFEPRVSFCSSVLLGLELTPQPGETQSVPSTKCWGPLMKKTCFNLNGLFLRSEADFCFFFLLILHIASSSAMSSVPSFHFMKCGSILLCPGVAKAPQNIELISSSPTYSFLTIPPISWVVQGVVDLNKKDIGKGNEQLFLLQSNMCTLVRNIFLSKIGNNLGCYALSVVAPFV